MTDLLIQLILWALITVLGVLSWIYLERSFGEGSGPTQVDLSREPDGRALDPTMLRDDWIDVDHGART